MLESREGSSGNQWESDGGEILVTCSQCVYECKTQPQPGWAPGGSSTCHEPCSVSAEGTWVSCG